MYSYLPANVCAAGMGWMVCGAATCAQLTKTGHTEQQIKKGPCGSQRQFFKVHNEVRLKEQYVVISFNPQHQMKRMCECVGTGGAWEQFNRWWKLCCWVSEGVGLPLCDSSHHITIIPEYRFPIWVCPCMGLPISVTPPPTTSTTTHPSRQCGSHSLFDD